jgi:hypothetical protein
MPKYLATLTSSSGSWARLINSDEDRTSRSAYPAPSAGVHLGASALAQPEHFVNLVGRQRSVGDRHGAEDVSVKIDLLERDLVMKPEVDVLVHAPTSSAHRLDVIPR